MWQKGRWALDKVCAVNNRGRWKLPTSGARQRSGKAAPHTLPAQPVTGALEDLYERDIRVALAGSPNRWVEHLSLECLSAAGEG